MWPQIFPLKSCGFNGTATGQPQVIKNGPQVRSLVWRARPSHGERKVWGHQYTRVRTHYQNLVMANQIAVRQARAFHWPIQDREAHNFHESSTMEFCYREAAKSLGYPTLKDEREKVLSKFLEGNVFVSLPTGYSSKESQLCCTTTRFRFEEIRIHGAPAIDCPGCISPLVLALMKDQVATYSASLGGSLSVVFSF